jgi:hypothetical protein
MTEDELQRLVTTNLDQDGEPWSEQPGGVLFSDMASVRPGRFCLMGINPGGPADEGKPIRDNLCAPCGTNAYADDPWGSQNAKSTCRNEYVT